MFLLRAIESGKHTDAAILDLIHRARTMPLEEWEARGAIRVNEALKSFSSPADVDLRV